MFCTDQMISGSQAFQPLPNQNLAFRKWEKFSDNWHGFNYPPVSADGNEFRDEWEIMRWQMNFILMPNMVLKILEQHCFGLWSNLKENCGRLRPKKALLSFGRLSIKVTRTTRSKQEITDDTVEAWVVTLHFTLTTFYYISDTCSGETLVSWPF